MAVYVDEVKVWPGKKPRCFYGGSCHLTADTPDELHLFATSIGLPMRWFQGHPGVPHYDLTPARRISAVAAGAVEVPAKEQARRRLRGRRS